MCWWCWCCWCCWAKQAVRRRRSRPQDSLRLGNTARNFLPSVFFQQETTTTPGDHQATTRRPPPRALQATTTTPEGHQETTKGSTRDHQKSTKRPRRRRPPGDPERLARERSRRLLIRQDLYRAGARDPEEHSSKCCRDLTFSTATRGSARRDARPHGFAVNSRTSAKSRHHATGPV